MGERGSGHGGEYCWAVGEVRELVESRTKSASAGNLAILKYTRKTWTKFRWCMAIHVWTLVMLGYRWKVTSSISIKTRVIQKETGDLTESRTRAPSETKSASLAIRDHRH